MEASGLSNGMMASGMMGLEIPLHSHRHHHQNLYQNQNQMLSFNPLEPDNHNHTNPITHSPQPFKQNAYSNTTPKGKQQQPTLSDDEDPDGGAGDVRKRVSPWQRVKWTDNMIRLLIMVVFYIEDDNGPEGSHDKKKSGGLLQKKGKWKSVSRAMMDKGFFVSPQQCEDKFNDLNKRYKRVNEILGKGTACRVVENQSLLDTMDQISPKMKEEARKLLNSKHLFFREMCAYHNSGGGGGAHQSEVAIEPSHYQKEEHCLHSTNGGVVSSSRNNVEMKKFNDNDGGEINDGDDEDEEDDEDEDYDDDGDGDGDEVQCGGRRISNEDEDESEKFSSKKRRRTTSICCSSASTPPLIQQLSCELMSVVQDGMKSPVEQRQWIRSRRMQLEEQQVSYQLQAFELEKQRLKWVKYSGKKEREMERMKLNNERMMLENERMVLLLQQKELELLDLQRQQQDCSKRPERCSITG